MAEEEAMVERLLTRLVMTEDTQLEKVLSKLLPYAISLMASEHNPTKVKVTQMLSHINKRVKDRPDIELPLDQLVKIYKAPDALSLVRNFSMVYVEMACDRSSSEKMISIIPDLLSGLSSLVPQHQDILLRLTAKALENIFADRILQSLAAKLQETLSASDKLMLLEFCLQTVLYQPSPASHAGEAAYTPPGLSLRQAARVCGKTELNPGKLVSRKLGLLNLVAKLDLEPQMVYILFLAAASESNDSISKRGEELMRKKASEINLEDTALLKRLFFIFQGTPENDTVPADIRVTPANSSLKARIMGIFVRSVAAANVFPMTLQCIFYCLYGNSTTSKLKQAGMEFTVWVFKHASSEQLKLMGPIILTHLMKLIGSRDGEPSLKPLRSFSYQAIGQLAQRIPSLFCQNTDMVKRLFGAIQAEEHSMRFIIQEALNSLAIAYKGCKPDVAKEIEVLLLENTKAELGEARFCAIFWATKIYEDNHVPSRYMFMLGAGDSKLDVREMALRGLKDERNGKAEADLNICLYPSLGDMMAFICEQQPGLLCPAPVGERVLLFPTKVYTAIISYVMKCFEVDHGQTTALLDQVWFLLEHGMAHDGSVELHEVASGGLLRLASENPQDFVKAYAGRLQWLKQFNGSIDANTREAMSRLLGIASLGLSSTEASNLLQQLVCSFDGTIKSRFEDIHGSICSAGYVLAQCMTGKPEVPSELQSKATAALIRLLRQDTGLIGGFAAEALGHAGLRGQLPIPLGDMSCLAKNESLAETFDGGELIASLAHLLSQLKLLLCSKESKVVQKSVMAFGHMSFGNPVPEILDVSVTALFDLRKAKVEDVLICVGEALAFIWGAIPVTADTVLQTNFVSLSLSTNFLTSDTAPSLHTSPNTLQDTDVRANIRERIMKMLFEDMLFSSRKEERCAGSVWLLSLVSYCGHHQHIQALLPKIQEAFSYLLGEQNELTQEMASRGMSIVYELGDAAMREELVKALVATLSGTAKKKRPIKLMEDSEVFEQGAIGEGPSGGNISTYKELCNLANEMGQPDLVYKFMDLANYQTSLNSKRGAAFGFAKIAKRAGDALEPHLRSLVPKLFRYQHDPNKHIQDAMGHIWKSLVAEPKKTVDMFFDDIMEDLIANAGSRFWRSREAACTALADVIQGRKFSEVDKYLLKLWTMAFRAMDDIKESVRNAGSILCRADTSLTLRLCDTSLTSEVEARASMAIVLPFLLSNGIISSVTDVRSTSISVIMKLVKGAGQAIRPQLPELVSCMLESLSSLEDQRLNYAELHAERVGISAEKLENARISIAKDSPMWDTLDFCLRQVDAETLERLTPRLVHLVRSGIGLNTRVGVARFITSLSHQIGIEIKQYSSTLLKALMPAVVSEKSAAARRSIAAACAAVMKYAPDRVFQQLLVDIVGHYKSGDKESRIASGLLLKELSRNANDMFKSNHTLVLSMAFIARFDEEQSVASDYEEVWEENTSSESVSVQLYMAEIIPMIYQGLEASSWPHKQQSAKAVVRLGEVAGEALAPHALQLVSKLLMELPGRLWEGKECVLDALAAVCKACPQPLTSAEGGSKFVVEGVAAACLRKKSSFRNSAYSCLEEVVKALKSDALEVALGAVREELSGGGKDMDISAANLEDNSTSSGGNMDKALGCLTACIATSTHTTLIAHAQDVTSVFVTGFKAKSWHVKLAALQSAKVFAEKCPCQELLQVNIVQLIFDCITNVKVSQVRIVALECLNAMVSCRDARLVGGICDVVGDRLREHADVEKNVNARSLIADIIQTLSNRASE